MKRISVLLLLIIILIISVLPAHAADELPCEHEYVVEYKNNTCTEDGYRADVCIKCGDTKNYFVFTAFGHGDYDYDNRCDRCGEENHNAIGRLRNFILRIMDYFAKLFGF